MTEKKQKHHHDEAEELKKELDKELKKSEDKNCKKELDYCKKEREKLKRKLKDVEEILKNTQIQYLQLKNEFDAYQRRIEQSKKQLEQETFEKVILNILPILELFMLSYEHLPEEFKEHKWVEGLNIVNKKIQQFLQNYNIEVIKTIGEDVDETKHEVIGMEPSDKHSSGKIIKEVKKGYIIKKDGSEKVLLPAKVIISQ